MLFVFNTMRELAINTQVGGELKPLPTVFLLLAALSAVVIFVFSSNNNQVESNVGNAVGNNTKVEQFAYFLRGAPTSKTLGFVILTGGILAGISYMLPRIVDNK